jgi:hypothetical protein
MTTKLITRMSKNLKAEAQTAANQIELDGYTVNTNTNTITCDEDTDGSFYGIWFYRNGEEVIAVPDFYIGEDDVSLTGSKGGEYTLNGETLEVR